MVKNEKHRLVQYVAAAIFAVGFILHAWRLYYQYPFVVGYTVVPMWVSWIGIVVAEHNRFRHQAPGSIRKVVGTAGMTTNVKFRGALGNDSPPVFAALSVNVCEPGVNAGNGTRQGNGLTAPLHVTEGSTVPASAPSARTR